MRCGFVAILGLPNAGKSTLINALVGGKISITSSKPQTTRRRILGIVIREDTQIILMDTPGMVESQRPLEKSMNKLAWESGRECDYLLYILDVSFLNKTLENKNLISYLHKLKCYQKPIDVVFNKVDLVKEKQKLMTLADLLKEECPFVNNFFMTSAINRKGVDDILVKISEKMPEMNWMLPKDQTTDLTEKLWAEEITREQIYHYLHQELPYQIYVDTESFEEIKSNELKIHQCIYVERESQKGIVLGKNGSMIKKISKSAREAIEKELGRNIHLFLYVKCQEEWSSKPWVLDHILNH
jgi:GTP-binding protein Era